MQQPPQGQLRLYACGGFGINIVSHFDHLAGANEPGLSIPHPVYIDTSRSNLHAGIKPEHVFILEDVDGSGKVRRENHEEISRTVKRIIQDHKPLDMNIVVFSASGGSGSVFGPLIISELLARKVPVVGIVVGSDESTITAQNTINTLKSLESIATKNELPVVIYYDHNEPEVKRSTIDDACRAVIASLSILSSRHNSELDSRDITNWVQFSRSTSVKPRLAMFDVYRSNEAAEEAREPVAIVSLYTSPDDTPLKLVPEYHAAGYPRSQIKTFKTAHFVITVESVQVVAKKLNATVADLDNARRSRVSHNSLVHGSDSVTDDGMVL